MHPIAKHLAVQAATILVSAVVSEIIHEVVSEVRAKRFEANKNPIGFVPFD